MLVCFWVTHVVALCIFFLALEHMVVFWARYGGKEIIVFLDDTV